MAKIKRITDAKKRKVYDDIYKGMSYRRAAEKHKISASMVGKIKKQFEKISPVTVKPKQKRKPATRKTKKKIGDAIVANNVLKKSDIIIGNILDVGASILKGARKLEDIADNSEERVSEMLNGLERLVELIESKVPFPDGLNGIKEKNEIIKDLYKVLATVGSYYSSNKIVIEAIRELRGHSETYVKLKMEADIIATLDIFVKSIFDALNLINDNDYIKFRDFVVQNSEMGKRLFAKFDEEVQV